LNFEWSRSLKFKITFIFSAGIILAFCVNWFIAINTMYGEKVEDLEKVLKHLLSESNDEYISSPLTPQSELSFLYIIPHNTMILKDSEASHLRFVVSRNPYSSHDERITSSIRLENGYFLNAISDNEKIESSIRKYGEKLLIRYSISFLAILVVMMIVLDYYMRPLAMLAQKTREWKRDEPFDFLQEDAGTEIREVSSAFSALVRKIEGYRQKETELFKEAAHELKTPLALMRSRLDVYLSTDNYDKEKFSHDLGHDIERLSDELKNVLFLESSDFEEPVSIDVGETFANIARKMEILIRRKELEILLPTKSFTITAPEKLMGKVFTALLENAITYAMQTSSVEIGVDPEQKCLWIANDTGNEKYLFSSKIGQKMLKRISREIGFGYTIDQQEGRYRIELHFA